MRIRICLTIALLALCSACAGKHTSRPGQNEGVTGRRTSRDIITKDDLARGASGNLYELVQQLRPTWLNEQRMGSSTVPVCVYQDEVRMSRGTPDILRDLQPNKYAQLKYWDPIQAAIRFALDFNTNCSVIQILTHL